MNRTGATLMVVKCFDTTIDYLKNQNKGRKAGNEIDANGLKIKWPFLSPHKNINILVNTSVLLPKLSSAIDNWFVSIYLIHCVDVRCTDLSIYLIAMFFEEGNNIPTWSCYHMLYYNKPTLDQGNKNQNYYMIYCYFSFFMN